MPEDTRLAAAAMLALGLLTGAAATLALLATRLRVYHHGDCPECGVALVVSYEPADAEPHIRRESEVEHPPGSRVGERCRSGTR